MPGYPQLLPIISVKATCTIHVTRQQPATTPYLLEL